MNFKQKHLKEKHMDFHLFTKQSTRQSFEEEIKCTTSTSNE